MKNAYQIHFLCKREFELSRNFSFNKNHFLLPNGIQINKRVNIKEEIKSQLRLLSVARIHPQKNLLELIKAVSMFKKEDIRLDIFGSIDDKNYFKLCNDFINKYSKDRIIINSPVSKKEILEIYKDYDLFCMPSLVEGISMALIEAASNGLPALITKGVANYKEILMDNAGILTKKDHKDIYKFLQKIYKNRHLLKKMKENAYLSAKNRYEINQISAKLLKKYNDICSNN